MGGDDGVGAVQQGMVGGQGRLRLKDIAGRSGNLALLQRLGQRRGIQNAAPGGADEDGAFLIRESCSLPIMPFVSAVRGQWRDTMSARFSSSSRGNCSSIAGSETVLLL